MLTPVSSFAAGLSCSRRSSSSSWETTRSRRCTTNSSSNRRSRRAGCYEDMGHATHSGASGLEWTRCNGQCWRSAYSQSKQSKEERDGDNRCVVNNVLSSRGVDRASEYSHFMMKGTPRHAERIRKHGNMSRKTDSSRDETQRRNDATLSSIVDAFA